MKVLALPEGLDKTLKIFIIYTGSDQEYLYHLRLIKLRLAREFSGLGLPIQFTFSTEQEKGKITYVQVEFQNPFPDKAFRSMILWEDTNNHFVKPYKYGERGGW